MKFFKFLKLLNFENHKLIIYNTFSKKEKYINYKRLPDGLNKKQNSKVLQIIIRT